VVVAGEQGSAAAGPRFCRPCTEPRTPSGARQHLTTGRRMPIVRCDGGMGSTDGARCRSHGWGRTMILLTRLNGSTFAVNPDLVERIQEQPDTTVVLVDGTTFIVTETIEEVIDEIAEYRA